MTLILYGHPFSSYCQKVIVALYENATPFELHCLDPADEDVMRAFMAHWPVARMPVLVDRGVAIPESTAIIEHLGRHHPGPVRLIPEDPDLAAEVRLLDRIFDNHVMTPMQQPVAEALRAVPDRLAEARQTAAERLSVAYGWLDKRLEGRTYAAGDDFTLADCAAAPALFYADWVHEITDTWPTLRQYRARLLARPSMARAVDEARPWRPNFPLGAPDRD